MKGVEKQELFARGDTCLSKQLFYFTYCNAGSVSTSHIYSFVGLSYFMNQTSPFLNLSMCFPN